MTIAQPSVPPALKRQRRNVITTDDDDVDVPDAQTATEKDNQKVRNKSGQHERCLIGRHDLILVMELSNGDTPDRKHTCKSIFGASSAVLGFLPEKPMRRTLSKWKIT
jgi:hypothetical protein